MKKMRMFLFGMLLLAGTVGATGRIAFVDLEEVFDRYYKTPLAKSRVELQQQEVEEERVRRVEQMQMISAEVDSLRAEARDMTLSEDVRDSRRLMYEERLLELREKQRDIEEFVQLRQQQLQEQVARMSQRIMDEVRQAVVDYARREGLHAVIDKSLRRAAVGVIIYTHRDVDITETILAELNRGQPSVPARPSIEPVEVLPELDEEPQP